MVLTGLRLGGPESLDLTHAHGEWAQRASLEAFLTEPIRFWEYFYPTALTIAARTPGPAHDAIARLERAGGLSANHPVRRSPALPGRQHRPGRGLRHRAGVAAGAASATASPEVGALIGAAQDGVPRCTTAGCGYPLRPEGTLWGEALPRPAVERAWELAADADAFFVLDSDLRTAPISLLPSVPLTRGAPLVLIGETPTQYDRYARMVVRAPSSDVITPVADLIAPGP